MAQDIEEQSQSLSLSGSKNQTMESPEPNRTTTTTTTAKTKTKTKRRRKRCICLWITVVILLIGLILLILGLTVFKVKQPTTGVESITLQNIDFAFDPTTISLRLNLTLGLNVSLHNSNRIGFKYEDSDAILRYRGNNVGNVPIPAGSIGARDTRSLNLSVRLMADRLLADSNAIPDVLRGALPFQTYVRMKGQVRILFTIHATASNTCDFTIFLRNQTVSDQKCRLKTKL